MTFTNILKSVARYALLVGTLVTSVPTADATIQLQREFNAGDSNANWSCSQGVTPCPPTTTTPIYSGGGNALRLNMYVPGAYPYTTTAQLSGGIITYAPPFLGTNGTEFYAGHYFMISNPFDWNPVGTKFDYFVQRDLTPGNVGTGRDNFLLMFQNNGNSLTFTQQLWQCNGTPVQGGNTCTQNRGQTASGWAPIQKGHLYWVSVYAKMNTWSSQTCCASANADGIIEVRLDGILVLRHTNVVHSVKPNNVFQSLQHVLIWGGGGGTVNQAQNFQFDHTIIATTLAEVGVPGAGGGDVTPPPVPNQPTVPTTGRPATTNWNAVSAGDLAGYRYYRKNESCTDNTLTFAFTADVGNLLTYQDTSIPPTTTAMCVKISSYDTTGNESALSTGTTETFTVGSASTVVTLASDTAGATITFSGSAYKMRYWDDLNDANNKVEISGLGGVSTYRLLHTWEQEITFMCAEAQGSDGIWETAVDPNSYRCIGVTPGSGDLVAPLAPTGLMVR